MTALDHLRDRWQPIPATLYDYGDSYGAMVRDCARYPRVGDSYECWGEELTVFHLGRESVHCRLGNEACGVARMIFSMKEWWQFCAHEHLRYIAVAGVEVHGALVNGRWVTR